VAVLEEVRVNPQRRRRFGMTHEPGDVEGGIPAATHCEAHVCRGEWNLKLGAMPQPRRDRVRPQHRWGDRPPCRKWRAAVVPSNPAPTSPGPPPLTTLLRRTPDARSNVLGSLAIWLTGRRPRADAGSAGTPPSSSQGTPAGWARWCAGGLLRRGGGARRRDPLVVRTTLYSAELLARSAVRRTRLVGPTCQNQ
jgi:hypothetical protein